MILPERPHLDHLKKQARELLRLYQDQQPSAFARLREFLPAAAGKDDETLVGLGLRLHDAQSCVAREYRFPSWTDLRAAVEIRALQADSQSRLVRWLRLVYGGILTDYERARPVVAARLLAEVPALTQNPYLACAACDEAAVRAAIAADSSWTRQPSPALKLPPLAAVSLSSIASLPEFRTGALGCISALLAAGSDPNQRWMFEKHEPLSALFGAAGTNHDPEMTAMLLAAGANPNDGESLYHSVESRDRTCTRLLLEAGATVEGSNALHHLLDREDPEGLQLLLSYTNQVNDPTSQLGTPLLWAIRRRRSARIVRMLLDAGASPAACNNEGINAYRLAERNGLEDIASLLREAGAAEVLSEEERFVAACALADRAEALRIQKQRPDLPAALSTEDLRQLPNLTEAGCDDAVRLMVELGWPIAVRGGDWSASALNLAVFRGNATLVTFLLQHGANWTETHGHGDNACGTLSWASCNNEDNPGERDWLGCARALVEYGMPGAVAIKDNRDPQLAECVSIDGGYKRFADDVTEFLLATGRETSG